MLASDLYVACYTLNMWSPLPPLIVFGQQPLWFWLIDYLRFYSPDTACWLNMEKLSSHKLPITMSQITNQNVVSFQLQLTISSAPLIKEICIRSAGKKLKTSNNDCSSHIFFLVA